MIDTLHLFEEVDGLLLALLAGLPDEAWHQPTIAGGWTVHQVAAHLLDTALRRLTLARDGWQRRDVRIRSDADLVAFVNQANAEGVRVYGHLSPRLLGELMSLATVQLRAHLREIPLDAPGRFPVSWAGQSTSPHWFDTAREYTERWHHQAQIRLAVDDVSPLMTARLYGPVIATFAHAWPHALRHVEAPEGATVQVRIEGTGGGAWRVCRRRGFWRFDDHPEREHPRAEDAEPYAEFRIPADLAWRLFTKGASRVEVSERCTARAPSAVADAVLGTRAIVG